MSKLDEYFDKEDEVDPMHAEDVEILKKRIPELKRVPNALIEKMYSDYCDMFAASWLILDESTIQSFKSWLR